MANDQGSKSIGPFLVKWGLEGDGWWWTVSRPKGPIAENDPAQGSDCPDADTAVACAEAVVRVLLRDQQKGLDHG